LERIVCVSVLRVCAAFLLFATGGLSIGVAIANAPAEGWCPQGAGCPPTRGLPETLYFVLLVGGVMLTVVGLAATYASLLRQSDGLD
jgi:hypothetical protein